MSESEIGNQYKFPQYYSSLYRFQGDPVPSLLPPDLTLGEYTFCHKSKKDVKNLILNITKFLEILNMNISNIDRELGAYEDTADPNDPDLFQHLLEYLTSHADEFNLQIGTNDTLSPTYLMNLKKAYYENPLLSLNKELSELLNSPNPEDIFKNVNLPPKFITRVVDDMLAAVIEKLSSNFKGSEFVIAFNLVIMEFNIQQFRLGEKLSTIDNLKQYLYESCPHTVAEITDLIEEQLPTALDNHYILSDGIIDYDTWIYNNLEQYQVDRIKQVKKIANLIMSNSWNEVISNTYLQTLYLNNLTYPPIEQGE